MKNNRRALKISGLILLTGLMCVFLTYSLTFFVYLPNAIYIRQGSEFRAEYALPFNATITPDNISAVRVNNEEVRRNITVDLSDGVTISSDDTGQAYMRVEMFGIPLKTVTVDILPSAEVIPCGMTIGVKISTEGVLVLGSGYVNGEDGLAHKPADGVLKSGDLIQNINGNELKSKGELISIIEESEGDISLTVKRGNESIQTKMTPVVSSADKKKKIGVWVRDQTQGIGTITYYNPDTGVFGALGHGIIDVDTKGLLSVKAGEVYKSCITSVKMGRRGAPGELMGDIQKTSVIGEVRNNNNFGIFGIIYQIDTRNFAEGRMKTALASEIHEGPAKILCNIDDEKINAYDIYVESVNRFSGDESKGLVLKITDPDLLSKTGGIVQGMSGSPIIQDGKLIGAVTHVFVQDPTKGYGIFIENMLKNEIKQA